MLVSISGLLVSITLVSLWEHVRESGEHDVKAAARIVQEQTDRTLQALDQRLQLAESELEKLAATGRLNGPSAQVLLRSQIQSMPFVRAMWVMDAQGRIVYDSDDGNVGVNLSERAYFQIYLAQPQTGFNLGAPVKSRNGVWVISATRPLHHSDGRFAGIVVAALLPDYFDNLWRAMSLGEGATVQVYRRDATLLLGSPLVDADIGQMLTDLPVFASLSQGRATGVFDFKSPVDGETRDFAYQALENYPGVAVVGMSHAALWSHWIRISKLPLAIWLSFVAIALGLLWALARDLVARKIAEADLMTSKIHLTATLNAVPDLLFEIGVDGRYYDYHSPRADLLAAPPEVFLGKLVTEVLPGPAADAAMAALREAFEQGFSSGQVIELQLAGESHWFELSASRKQELPGESPRCIMLSRDISERMRVKQALSDSLAERTALLNEVHHRVKNNLQVITSLLRLEIGRSNQPDTRTVLNDMTGRIRAMALLHESLYRSGTFAQADLGQYLQKVGQQGFRANAPAGTALRLEMELASVLVSLDMAGPFGLLVNELISNSLKHGFPQGQAGVVRLTLKPDGGTRWSLCVSDTGVGLQDDFDIRCADSLGMQLVSDLTQQIGGTLQVEAHGGENGGAMFRMGFEVRL